MPVVVSGVSGESLATFEEKPDKEERLKGRSKRRILRHYGGGGSGVYFPTEDAKEDVWPTRLPWSASRLIYLADLSEHKRHRRIEIPDAALRIHANQY